MFGIGKKDNEETAENFQITANDLYHAGCIEAADRTQRNYAEAGWDNYSEWCEERHETPKQQRREA